MGSALDGPSEGDSLRLLAQHTPDAYAAERQRIMDDMRRRILAAPKQRTTERAIEKELDSAHVDVGELETIDIGGTPRRAIHFHRFRSRGREAQPDAAGALLRIELPEAIEGPLAIGYGSHFGLGLFSAVDGVG